MKKLVGIMAAVLILTGCANEASEVFQSPESSEYITVSFSGKPEFGPHSTDNPSMGFCLGMIYEPLWRMEKDGSVSPVLAEKTVNRGIEVDIYLKEGIKWHDGSDFVPDDVVYTVALITHGMSVYPRGVMDSAWVSGKHRVTVRLTSPVWEPERIFTFPVVKNGAPLHLTEPVGTGMYKFVRKNGFDTYLFETAEPGSGLKLRMIRVRDAARETELFKSGITDAQFVSNVNLIDYIPLESSEIIKYPTNHMIYIGFNLQTVSPNLRRALFYALDTGNIAEEAFGENAKGTVVPYLSENSFLYKHLPNLPLSRSELKAGQLISRGGRLFSGSKAVILKIGVSLGEGHSRVADAVCEVLAGMGAACVTEEWKPESSEVYDIVIGTDTPPELFEKYPGFGSYVKHMFHNDFFSNIPFIPVAFRCNAVFISGNTGKFPGDFPLFFW